MGIQARVFISHASEDKDRFVTGFAEKLLGKGIDAWVDEWEMSPGDSLIDKIFEGIKNAHAMIIILSKNSVKKRWVKEELNAGMINRINAGTKLIPVIIDECEVPECLQTTLWQKIKDIENYDEELERIVMAIYDHKIKPALGPPPSYVNLFTNSFPGLEDIDSIIMKMCCDKVIQVNQGFSIKSGVIFKEIETLQINETAFYESLEIMDNKGYIKALKVLGGTIPGFTITTYGFEQYAKTCIEDYENIFQMVCARIVNYNEKANKQIIQALRQPEILVDHILSVLNNNGLIKISSMISGRTILISSVSPELKRILRKI